MEPSSPEKLPETTRQTVSQRSFDRIERLLKSVAGPYACVHQTFTFAEHLTDLPTAKIRLKKTLDLIHKRFEAAAIYVFERQRSGRWHIHVLFLFFGASEVAPAVPAGFSQVVFGAWNRINGGKCNRAANKSSVVERILPDYLLKSVVVEPGTKRDSANWWGYRNQRLLSAHKEEAAPRTRRKKWSGQLTPRITGRDYLLMGAKRESNKQGISWAAFKRGKLNSSLPVTDKQLLDFLESPEAFSF